MSAPDRRAKLDRDHPELSIRQQCAMLDIARSGVYRQRKPANDNDLSLMRRIDTDMAFLAETQDVAQAIGRDVQGPVHVFCTHRGDRKLRVKALLESGQERVPLLHV